MTAVEPRPSRSPGITYQELLDRDSHPVPDVLRWQAPPAFGSADVSIERYVSREWHERERELLWKKVWQFACRLEQIPETGDHVVYEIAGLSYVVIRQADGSVKAFPNACLHRGRQLKDHDGHASELRCPFHGFCWKIDGQLSDVPAQWDFPHVEERRDSDFALPECKVGIWAGFVFINPDSSCASFEDFVAGLDEHFHIWDLENRYIEAHVTKVIEANWKVAQEAFCEAYHVNATHPQILYYLGDTNSQVDVWENFSRVITAGLTPSPHLWYAVSEEEMLRSMLDVRVDQASPLPIPPGGSAREIAAASARERWRPVVGDRVDRMSDAEMMDSIDYTVFPNFHPWGAFNRIVYRFRPNGDDHRSSVMEVMFLSPFNGERPANASRRDLGVEESWTTAPELGMLAKVFDQDVFNMAKVQKGLETTSKPGVTLSNYQEAKVRWFHQILDRWMEDAR